MPLYNYQCPGCHLREIRVAGVDDHAARCPRCGRQMRRQADPNSLFIAYG